MGIYHVSTLTPSKLEIIAGWIPTQPWGPSHEATVEVLGSYRFDDPNGRVGLETHLVLADGQLFQVPLTYRDEPLGGADHGFISEMHHSALGTRFIYDGLADPLYRTMLAGVSMTGQGEALGMVMFDGRSVMVPSVVRIQGGGWSHERVAVDGFEPEAAVPAGNPAVPEFRNDRFALRVFRRPAVGPQPAIGLTATWNSAPPVVLAEIYEL
jgi:hypothetical protein